ncbi:MAG: transcriptional regulator [Devosia sp.]|nr:transcriptional regulator [Devosia sp.]
MAHAWGDVPDWVDVLATYADANSAKAAAEAVGYSAAALSVVMNRAESIKNFDLGRIEQAVRGALMGLTVDCPVERTIGRETCLANQKLPFSAHRRERVALYHACRSGCPHFLAKGGSNGTE